MTNNRIEELIMLEIEYITDKDGQQKGVVIPIKLWRKILPPKNASVEPKGRALFPGRIITSVHIWI